MPTLLVLLALAAAPEAGPMKAEPAIQDLGEIRSGPVLVREFILRHSGAGAITISRVDTGCGCLKADLSAGTLEPGGSLQLKLALNTLTPPEGPVSWRATVHYTVAGNEYAAEVRVMGTMVRDIRVTPPALAATLTGELSQTLVLADRRSKPLTITVAECTLKEVRAEIRPAVDRDGQRLQEIAVTVAAGLAAGTHDGLIVLFTEDKTCPELRVPLRLLKPEPHGVTVSPSSLTLRLNTKQAETSLLAQIRAGGKPVAIERIDCPTAGLGFRFAEGAGPVATLRASVQHEKAGPAGYAEAVVTLKEPAGVKVNLLLNWYTP